MRFTRIKLHGNLADAARRCTCRCQRHHQLQLCSTPLCSTSGASSDKLNASGKNCEHVNLVAAQSDPPCLRRVHKTWCALLLTVMQCLSRHSTFRQTI